jgi:UDP-glucose 4-epimerase
LLIREASISDARAVHGFFQTVRPEVVLHAAASYKDPDNWIEDVLTNVAGTVNVVQECKCSGVCRLIYFQTALCYGLKPLERPITVNHPLNPQGSSYAITKTAAEHYIFLSGIESLSFRLANVYGPRNVSGPLPTFYTRLTSGKRCFVMDTRRDFLFVDDLVDVVLQATLGRGKPGVYHVSTGSDYAIQDLYQATLKALGLNSDYEVEVRPRNPDDAPSILLDPTKTWSEFDWKARTPLDQGVAKAIEWYRKNEVPETYTHLKSIESPKS